MSFLSPPSARPDTKLPVRVVRLVNGAEVPIREDHVAESFLAQLIRHVDGYWERGCPVGIHRYYPV